MTNIHPLRPTRRLEQVEITGDSYGQLLSIAATTGRCPVWVAGYGVESIDVRWEPKSALAQLDSQDAGEVLAERWPGRCLCPENCMAPFGDEFPGLTPRLPVDPTATIDHAIATAMEVPRGDLAVIPATRPADILAATGWTGMFNSWDDVVGASAVLRSWEERFGAILIRMHRATLDLAVAAPPVDTDECLRVAAEHIAFCWDAFETYTGQMSTDTLRRYAQRLDRAPRWKFWWD